MAWHSATQTSSLCGLMMRWMNKWKVLRCYILILGWLAILLLALSYWRIESSSDRVSVPAPVVASSDNDRSLLVDGEGAGSPSQQHNRHRFKKIRNSCNPPDKILANQEGTVLGNSQYKLSGAVILFRHGDRGPLISVKNISSINCGRGAVNTSHYKKYVHDILNVSKTNNYMNLVGPMFMKYPLLPSPTKCALGHLTPMGIIQHLSLGKMVQDVYITRHSLLQDDSKFKQEQKLVIYSTKYRRTFQSLMAFLMSALKDVKSNMTGIRIREGRGVSFCENHCHCDNIDKYDQLHETERRSYRQSHPGVMDLLKRISSIVLPSAPGGHQDAANPSVMRDALLAYACHGAPLPCGERGNCVKLEDLGALLSYEEWEAKQKRTAAQRKAAKLRSYGLLKALLNHMDNILGDGAPKLVVYSGHDKTLKYMLDALGTINYQIPYYASRIIFEVYANVSSQATSHRSHLFRIIYNGSDITKNLPFCKNGGSIEVLKQRDGSGGYGGFAGIASVGGNIGAGGRRTATLCQISRLQSYAKANNYFKEFGNASSFREACTNNV